MNNNSFQLVIEQQGKAVTDSLMVAEVFGKRHANVLRDIKSLECSDEFNELNFELIDYTDVKGELRPKYYMTQDGFTFLVMGYKGKEAASFKENYIKEFNRMRDELALRSPANDYLNMSDEDRAIAYFMKVKAEKAQYLILVYGLSSYYYIYFTHPRTSKL